jgi:hypothetical protein
MGEGFVAVGGDLEDPSLYQDPVSGALHMLMHTQSGGGAGGSAHSSDLGKTWAFDESKHSYDYTVTMVPAAGGKQLALTNREEPKLLLDGTVLGFGRQFALEDAISSHACSLEPNTRVI